MSSSSEPLVSIAILNWNGLEETKHCLEHIKKLSYSNYEIIVVDNGSRDGSKKYFSERDDITFIDLPKNTGFTGGHIAANRHAHGEFLMIINNDLAIDPQWINECLATFKRHPRAAAVGGKLYKWNNQNPLFDKNNEYYAYQEVNLNNANTYTTLVGEEERPVDSISGAALLLKRGVLERVGYFDDVFFAYYEETDLLARMWRAGYEVYYNPAAMAWHKVAASSEGGEASAFYLYMMHRNRYMFAVKNFDGKYLKFFYKSYFREVAHAGAKFILRRDMESKLRLKAYAWNKIHHHQTLAKRREVLKLGPSYINKIRSYKPTDVTIVIPCYNYGNYVKQAIDSALAQTMKPQRIIVINDGSTDDSKQVIDSYKNNPLVEIVHKRNSGVIGTKNLGLSMVGTYWTIFLDADDILDKDYIEKTVELANKNSYDIVYTDMEYFGAVKDIFRSQPFNIFPMLQRNFVHNSALTKTSLAKQAGGYKKEMKDGLEDWDLFLSLYEVGGRFGYLPEHIFKYRQHEGALSRNKNVETQEDKIYRILISMHPGLFKHMSPARRRILRAFRFLWSFVRYPGLFIVVVASIPKAVTAGARAVLHEVRTYKSAKEGPR